jgi:hypothetical protein
MIVANTAWYITLAMAAASFFIPTLPQLPAAGCPPVFLIGDMAQALQFFGGDTLLVNYHHVLNEPLIDMSSFIEYMSCGTETNESWHHCCSCI